MFEIILLKAMCCSMLVYFLLLQGDWVDKVHLKCFNAAFLECNMYGFKCERKQMLSSRVVKLDPVFILRNFD